MKLPAIQIKKLFFYLIFWAVIFYSALEIFSRTDEIRIIDVIYTFLFLMPFVVIVSLHSFHLIPHYLEKSRFWLYGLTLFVLLATTYPIYNFSYLVLSEWLFPDYYLVGVYTPLEVLGFSIFFLLISSSLELSRNWFEGLRAKSRISELESEQFAAELKALRAQVNPHFLFNSLNTIYSEALDKSDKTPKLILKLSDMLRYAVDNMQQELVSVEDEIEYIKNYIELHRERLNDPSKIHFIVEGKTGPKKIAPMLIINFIENSFKHADLTEDDSFISIHLTFQNQFLSMTCKNTFYPDDAKKKEHGSGLQNAKKRLSLLYPDRHELKISNSGNVYHLELNLELDECDA
jgi:hypothetical protein